MIIRRVIIFLVLITSIKLSYCQVVDIKDSTVFYDADSVKLGVFYKTNEKIDSTAYWDINGTRISVMFEVPKYKHSYDSLDNFLLDEFRKDSNDEEVCGVALVYILLSDDKIKEIRIGRRIGYNRKYDPLIIKVLKKTQGNWIFPCNIDKPLLFTYMFKMK